MTARDCKYCSFGDCEIDNEECEYDNYDYKRECEKFRHKHMEHGDEKDDDLFGGIATGIAIGGILGGFNDHDDHGSGGIFGGFGGGRFGGGGSGGGF